MSIFESIHQQFPILSTKINQKPLIYFDNAATTQKPNFVIEAVSNYYAQQNANVHRASHHLSAIATQAFEQSREDIRQFINAAELEEIIWTRGATESINLVANSWGQSQLKVGDEIIISCLEHHANIVPWQLVAQQTGAIIRVAELDEDGCIDLNYFASLLSPRTKMVAITHISNALGIVTPLESIIQLAHQAGALVLVDGTQAVAHQVVEVQKLKADFYVFSGHKMYGPTGVGVLYGRRALLEAMPPWMAGGEMIEHVSFEKTTFNQLPFKFEAGTPNIAGVIGLGAACRFLTELSLPQIHQHEATLQQQLESGLRSIKGIRVIGSCDNKAPIASFVSEHHHHQDIAVVLDQQGVAIRTGHHCTMPLMAHFNLSGTLRASLAMYNTTAEIEQFLTLLEQTQAAPLFAVDNDSLPSVVIDDTAEALLPFSIYTRCDDEAAIQQRFEGLKNWQDRYRQIMLLGKTLPTLPDEYRTESARLHGCESRVWLHSNYDTTTDQWLFAIDSDARVIRGLIAIIIALYSGKNSAAIQALDIEAYFQRLELFIHLSPSRGNGLRAIIQEIQKVIKN